MTEFEVVSSFHCAKSLTKRSSFVRLLEDNKRDASEKRGSGTTMSFPGKVMDIREFRIVFSTAFQVIKIRIGDSDYPGWRHNRYVVNS